METNQSMESEHWDHRERELSAKHAASDPVGKPAPVAQPQRQKQPKQQSAPNLPRHVVAMMQSNKAANLIERGDFERAARYLEHLCARMDQTSDIVNHRQQQQQQQSEPQNASCTCSHCELEHCMVRAPACQEPLGSFLDQEEEMVEDIYQCATWRGGYLYCQPLRVADETIQEQHHMGHTFSLIVLFNLALVYQLMAVDGELDLPVDRRKQLLLKSHRLYQACYQSQKEFCEHSHLRFTACLLNNLCEVHRVEGNFERLWHDGEELISIMVYLVDCSAIYDDETLTEEEWDGFFRNVSRLILRDVAAGAA